MPADDAFNEALLFHLLETIGDLVFVRHQERPAALERDVNLDGRETSPPAKHDPPHGAANAATTKDEDGNRSDAPVGRTADRLTGFAIIQSRSLRP